MDIPYRVCVAAGIVLLAVSCSTTRVVILPALDASVTTEAETLVVYVDTDYVDVFVAPGQVVRGAGKGAALAMGDYLRGMSTSEVSVYFGIVLAPILLPTAGLIGAGLTHSDDEVDAAAKAFNSVGRDKELLTSIGRRFVEALDTDTTKQWVCIEATSVAQEEPCLGESDNANLELRPVFILIAEGRYNPNIIISANVVAWASGSESSVMVYEKWMYREELGDYFELAKDDAALLRGNIERILDRFAEKIAEDLYVAPRATTIVRITDHGKGTTVPEIPEGVVVRVGGSSETVFVLRQGDPEGLGPDTKQTNLATNITGTYLSNITSSRVYNFRGNLKNLEITLEQRGNIITGTDRSGKAEIDGILYGDTIKFDFWMGSVSSTVLSGEWVVNSDSDQLEGFWEASTGGVGGQWNLTKIE